MRPDFEISDGHGDKNKLRVYPEGNISVVVHDHPPIGETVPAYPFSQWFTDNGGESGSSDMAVDGSTTPVEFSIAARDDVDIYIKTISILISDNSATLDKFGNLTALTNGVDFKYFNQVIGEVSIQDGMKTNLDVIRVGLGSPAVGDGSSAFRADTSGAGADTYLPFFDLSLTFGFPWGVRIKAGSTDRILFRVNDLLTGLDAFNIKGFGVQLESK